MLYKMPDGKVEHFSSGRVWTVSQPQNVAFDIELSRFGLNLIVMRAGDYLAPWGLFSLGVSQKRVFRGEG
jgi:hypothetical protein